MEARRRPLALLVGFLVVASVLVVGPSPVAIAAPSGTLTPVPSGGVAEVVVDASGTTAYTSNPPQNRIEVLTVATGALGTPIPLGGTEPRALDLSADGTTLYVANAASQDISVVDLAARRELRRIALPTGSSAGRPTSIAVAGNGTALVTRMATNSAKGAVLLQVDLAAGAVRERSDWQLWTFGADQARATATRDRSRVALIHEFQGVGDVSFYDTATDGFTRLKTVAGVMPLVATDATGSTVLAGANTVVLDGQLALHATVPGTGIHGLALNASGTTGYRLREGSVDVVDVERAVVAATIAVPYPMLVGSYDMALASGDTSLVVLTGQAIAVIPVGSAVPVPCPRPVAPAGVVAVCGAPLTDVVIGGNRAYASNPAHNQIEVVSLGTRALEAPIPVGSQPKGLALSPDRSTLYVANTGAEDVSVVDLATRREVRRISVAAPRYGPVDRPSSIAVANNGTALLTTTALLPNGDTRLLQLDLVAGTFRVRTDPTAPTPIAVDASGDGSRIGALPRHFGITTAAFYEADSDSFTAGKDLGGSPTFLALDGTGSKLLMGPAPLDGWYRPEGATVVFDAGLVRRATVPGGGPIAVNGPGTTAYRAQWREVEVIDLARALVVRSIPLPEVLGQGTGAMALSPDGATLAVLTASGVSVTPVSSAVGLPPCKPAKVVASVAAVCGVAKGEVVIDKTGHAYVSNPDYNRIEVVSLATGALEAPIPVGSRPGSLDLDADGTMLYVAGRGAEELFVVDLARRREVRRITVPSTDSNDRPYSIAVADNGNALYTANGDSIGYGGQLWQVDLADGTVKPRTDFGPNAGRTGSETILKASADKSRIVIVQPDSGGPTAVYTSAPDTITTELGVGDYVTYAALDQSGSRILLSPGGFVLDGTPQVQGTIPRGGKGVAVNRAGTIGFRVQDTAVEVIDLGRRVVLRSIPLPEAVGTGRGSVALSPDGATLAVVTASGVSLVKTGVATMEAPSTTWAQPSPAPVSLDGLGTWMATANRPTAGPGQQPPSYLYGTYFGFADSPATGVVGLVTTGGATIAVFSVVEPDGTAHTAAVPFNWTGGRYYFTLVHRVAPGVWTAWVYDFASSTWVVIGQLTLPDAWGGLSGTSTTTVSWFGPPAPTCSAYPRADVLFAPPMGFAAGAVTTAEPVATNRGVGDCPTQSSLQVWARYALGT